MNKLLIALFLLPFASLLPIPPQTTLPVSGCGVYAWENDVVWFVWHNPPAGAVKFQETFYLKDLKTGVEFLTGGESDAIYYQGDLYGYFEYPFSDSRIRSLNCIAVMSNGSKVSQTSPAEWYIYFRFLPLLFRLPQITLTPLPDLPNATSIDVSSISDLAARMEVTPHFMTNASYHKIASELIGGDCNGDWLPANTCWGELHVYADDPYDHLDVAFYQFLADSPYYTAQVIP